ncbi:hypothetical protein [Kribbella flavida]|uniref:hypothetical protein n=1 Tax=Kribbella flavida TaxID=182640 RepID=UPI00019BFAF0|nr:hypothetical protein [Kribbella flavida]
MRELAIATIELVHTCHPQFSEIEAAQEAGFRHASRQRLVQLDADLQSPPEEALTLLAGQLVRARTTSFPAPRGST